MPSFETGESIPPDTAHAVSVSLPTWKSNVAYEEGEDWVMSSMVTGYPRFFVHRSINAFALDIVASYGQPGQHAMLFPTQRVAERCVDFILMRVDKDAVEQVRALNFVLDGAKDVSPSLKKLSPTISAVIFPNATMPIAKQYWQHTGDGTSSRRAEFCHGLFKDKLMVAIQVQQSTPEIASKPFRGPRRYQRPGSIDGVQFATSRAPTHAVGDDSVESLKFLEERFGRNLSLSMVERAKSAIRRRIAGALNHDVDLDNGQQFPSMTANTRGVQSLEEGDVYLYPAGMNAIYNAHRALLRARTPEQSINFGFPYVDTLKILQKFGPGCLFYGNASSEDLDDLESRLNNGERFLALFCEFPGNPLLTCPDLIRIQQLAKKFDFALVVDETIGTFVNVNVLQYADIVVSSLTKIFSGDANVMGGCAILNPESRYYDALKSAMEEVYEDTYWHEDVIFMERNSRDFASRIERSNANSEAICEILRHHQLVKAVYYPKYTATKPNYDACKLPKGGYGGLLSVVFQQKRHAQAFYDAINTAKGPSLGTNFTLCSPYAVLAHYQELPWAAQFGVDADLIRVSVGLEETSELVGIFQKALKAAESVDKTP